MSRGGTNTIIRFFKKKVRDRITPALQCLPFLFLVLIFSGQQKKAKRFFTLLHKLIWAEGELELLFDPGGDEMGPSYASINLFLAQHPTQLLHTIWPILTPLNSIQL